MQFDDDFVCALQLYMLWQFILLGVFSCSWSLFSFFFSIFLSSCSTIWEQLRNWEQLLTIKEKAKNWNSIEEFGTIFVFFVLFRLVFFFSYIYYSCFCFSVHLTFFLHNLFVLHIQIYINSFTYIKIYNYLYKKLIQCCMFTSRYYLLILFLLRVCEIGCLYYYKKNNKQN